MRFLHPGHSDPDAISVVTHTYTESQFISVKSVTDSIQAVQDSTKPGRYWRPSSYERTNHDFPVGTSVLPSLIHSSKPLSDVETLMANYRSTRSCWGRVKKYF